MSYNLQTLIIDIIRPLALIVDLVTITQTERDFILLLILILLHYTNPSPLYKISKNLLI